jgi:hypothetical protein
MSLRAYKSMGLWANVGYNEEVHRSNILGIWSSMIGYEMGSSPRLLEWRTSRMDEKML